MIESYGAVVIRNHPDTEYLLVRHAAGHWDFPKGRPLPGEGPRMTAVREVLEETGYNVSIPGDFSEVNKYSLPDGVKKCVIFFLAMAVSFDKSMPADPGEILDVKWMRYEQAMDKLSYTNSKKILQSAEKYLQSKGNFKE